MELTVTDCIKQDNNIYTTFHQKYPFSWHLVLHWPSTDTSLGRLFSRHVIRRYDSVGDENPDEVSNSVFGIIGQLIGVMKEKALNFSEKPTKYTEWGIE